MSLIPRHHVNVASIHVPKLFKSIGRCHVENKVPSFERAIKPGVLVTVCQLTLFSVSSRTHFTRSKDLCPKTRSVFARTSRIFFVSGRKICKSRSSSLKVSRTRFFFVLGPCIIIRSFWTLFCLFQCIRWRGENLSCSVWEPGLSWFVTMARIPLCVQCGTRQNPCHCKVVGPTLGVVAFIIAAVVEWPVGAVVWCFRHAKGRRIMAHPDRVVYPRVSSAIPFWRTSFTSSSVHLSSFCWFKQTSRKERTNWAGSRLTVHWLLDVEGAVWYSR